MADAAAARREARRRRILENSHNRLQLISGKCGDDCPRESPVRTIIPDPIHEISLPTDNSSSKTSLNNGVITSESDSFDLLSLNHDIAAGDGEVPSDLAPFASPAPEPASTPSPSLLEKITNNKYDIVLLSLLIQLLYSLSLVTFDDTYFFLPVLIYVITKLVWFPSQSNSKLANALQLLHIVSSHRVKRIIYLTQCMGVISCDICVFLFTTICIQSLLITLKDGLIT
ncbi:uncharacterized protein LOC110377697 [Helicoverpa armigera]|uniref:uncharacterized protein LOC110377697 n=1 Tax=Helicoverpa armigera TaxID=29058 RepID=UPI000B3A24BB